MQNDRDFGILMRMVEHCDRIEDIKRRLGNQFEAFADDAVYEDAINMNIYQIGELSNLLSDEFKDSVPDIPWHMIYGIRNVIAHAYIIVDKRTIWDTVMHDIPGLSIRLKEILGLKNQ